MDLRPRICANNILITLNYLLILISVLNLSTAASSSSRNQSELRLLHVIFAHKLQSPLEKDTLYGLPRKLDYEYFLGNTYEMANKSKVDMYNLGVYLRQRYNDFLGELYYPEVLTMRTSEYPLSMIAGLLVNAGLWPPAPSQKWSDELDWQPIPTEYEQIDKDTLFLGTLCPHFVAEEEGLMKNDEYIRNSVSIHEPLFEYVSKHYGATVKRPSEIALLYTSLETIAITDRNASLPAWTEGIFPHGEMMNVSLLAYDQLSRTASQKRLNGGNFLQKIIDDSAKAPNDPNRLVKNSRELKIAMYSGEERNLVGVMQALNLWWSPHIPESGASIIFELRYDESTGEHGFEVFYYTGVENNETIALAVPGCANFCPLNDFNRIVAGVLPIDEFVSCHAKLPIENEDDKSSSADSYQHRHFIRHYILVLFPVILSSKYELCC